jgi:hypothetical protein
LFNFKLLSTLRPGKREWSHYTYLYPPRLVVVRVVVVGS